MEETNAIFEKEDAVRLLNYLISYRKMTGPQLSIDTANVELIPETEKIVRE